MFSLHNKEVVSDAMGQVKVPAPSIRAQAELHSQVLRLCAAMAASLAASSVSLSARLALLTLLLHVPCAPGVAE